MPKDMRNTCIAERSSERRAVAVCLGQSLVVIGEPIDDRHRTERLLVHDRGSVHARRAISASLASADRMTPFRTAQGCPGPAAPRIRPE
jgi:hypothetical protein